MGCDVNNTWKISADGEQDTFLPSARLRIQKPRQGRRVSSLSSTCPSALPSCLQLSYMTQFNDFNRSNKYSPVSCLWPHKESVTLRVARILSWWRSDSPAARVLMPKILFMVMYNEWLKDKWAQSLLMFHVLFFIIFIFDRIGFICKPEDRCSACLCECECALFKHFT